MGRSCIVSLDGNPLSRQTLAEMTDAIVEDDYNGPIVTMSYPSTDRRRRVAVDADAVLLDDACGNVPAWSDVAAFGDGHFARLLDDRVVAERIRVWVADGDAFQELDLSGLGLSSLPALPPTLRRLNARDNQLVTLPATLPDSLRVIDVSSNQLTSLPEHLPAELQTLIATFNNLSDLPKALPNSLVRLDVAANEITTLPERLPASLVILKAANNLITKVPDNLPAPLEMLNLSGNRIESFPPGLLLQLGRNCVVLLDDNPLSRQTFAETTEALASSDYSGPIVSISYPSTPDDGEGVLEATAAGWLGVEPADKRHGLVDAVAAWFDAGDATVPAWSEFAGEDGAEEFGGFLMELQGTTSYSDPEFRRGVVTLLDAALAREGVRKNVFRAAVGATTSCEDRVTSACNAMQVALLVADVEEGVYDKRLADVIELARCMLRIDAIERIALETIKSDGVGDPLGFYLAHLVALRERLNLGFLAPRMFFYAASGVNAAGLDEAEKRVRQEEAAGFEDFLNGWGPWEAVARRVAPQDYAQMEEELVEAMGERFDLLLQERLVEAGVAGREDSEVKFGAEVREELAREIKGKLTRLVLEKEGLAHLLTRPD